MTPSVRICMVGKPMEHHVAADAWAKWCAGFLKEQGGDEAITGLLMTLPTGWIMLAEGTHATLVAFMRAISGKKGHLYEEIKVIHNAEDIEMRSFSSWGSKTLSVSRNNYADVEGGQLAAMLGETVVGMLKIGRAIGPMGSSELDKLDAWTEYFPDIPSNERVGQVHHPHNNTK